MTSKERVRNVIQHRQPDRVAIDFYARHEVVEKLRQRLNLKPDDKLEDHLGVDLRGVGPVFMRESPALCYADPTVRVTEEGVYCDIWGVGFKPNQTTCGFYMDLALSPLRQVESVDDLAGYPWPSADLWDYSTIAEQARANAAYWTWAHSRGIFEISWFLRGFEEFMTDLACNPGLANAIMDHVQGYLMERTRRILEVGRGLIDMVEYNDDVGGQEGLLIAPETWREYLKPRMAAFIRMCKKYGVAVRYHSCGGIRPIIPDLIEIGLDVLNPVQALAAGMDPEGLKRDFGADLTFNGGIDTQGLLPNASANQVRESTRRLIDVVGRDGGLILAPSHVFQDDVPIENIIAVYETALGCAL
jgi:uroporphyrinogen decarboxylase